MVLVAIDPILILRFRIPGLSHVFALLFILIVSTQRVPTHPSNTYGVLGVALLFLATGLTNWSDPSVTIFRSAFITYHGLMVFALYAHIRQVGAEVAPVIVGAYMFGTIGAAIFGWYTQYLPGMRLSLSPDYNPTWIGAGLAATSLMSVTLAGSSADIQRSIAYIVLAAIAGLLLVLTQAQTAIVSLVLGLTVFVLLRKRSIVSGLAVSGLLVIGAVNLTEWAEQFDLERIERTLNTSAYSLDEITAGRTSRWADIVENFDRFRIQGLGWGNASQVSSLHLSPHNTYLTVLLEGGLLAAFVLLLLHVVLFVRCAVSNPAALPLVVFFSAFLMGNDLIHYKYAWVIVGAFVLVAAFLRHRRTAELAFPEAKIGGSK